MKKWLLISGLVLLAILLGGWLMIRNWAATPYGKVDTRTAIILKLANLNDKSGPAPTPAEMRANDEKLNELLSAQSKVCGYKIQPLGTQLCWHLTTQNRLNHGDTQDTATR